MKKRSNLKLIILISLFLQAHNLWAYPFFYECDSKHQLKNIETPEQLKKIFEQFHKLSKHEQEQAIENACQGEHKCMAELTQMATLYKINQAALNDIIKNETAKLDPNSQVKETSQLYSTLKLKSHLDQHRNLIACHNAKRQLPKGNRFRSYYPNYSNYMYITGCQKLESDQPCFPANEQDVRSVVQNALAAGADPYATLAISHMENGNGVSGLYLDPVGITDALGCSGKPLSNNAAGKNVMNSYGTKYEIPDQLLTKPKLEKSFKALLKAKNEEITSDKPSYYCIGATTGQSGEYSTQQMKGACCVKFPFSSKSFLGGQSYVNQILTYSHVNTVLGRAYGNQKDPAYRAQRFNGYTDLMGGAEPVPAFRAGVNYYEDPAYGYQTMDFMINSLLSNPDLNRIVKEEQEKMGANYPSLLCLDRGPGLFHIDTNYYFEKHKNTPRLKKIIPKIQSGSMAGLSSREKKVLNSELNSPNVTRQLVEAGHITVDDIDSRHILGKLGSIDPNSLAPSLNGVNDKIAEREDFLNRVKERYPELKEDDIELFRTYYDLRSIKHSDIPSGDNSKAFIQQKSQQINQIIKIFEEKSIDLTNCRPKRYVMPLDELKQKTQFHSRNPIEQKAILKLHKLTIDEAIFGKYQPEKISKNMISPNTLKFYAREIYKTRDTVGKASEYAPWGEFSDEQIEKLAQRIK